MAIKEFKGKYFFLSNFYTSPVPLGGIIFPTGEHAFQAAKCINSDDVEKIAKANTPSAAKALGRRVHMRPDWEDVKYGVMLEVVRAKFYADYGLAKGRPDEKEIVVVHGAARGADRMAKRFVDQAVSYFRTHGTTIRQEPHPVTEAEWARFKGYAGN